MEAVSSTVPGSAALGAGFLVQGETIVYRLHDVGYEIDLDRAFALLADQAPDRARPVRGEAQGVQIPNPPVTVSLGVSRVHLGGEEHEAHLSARLFDFGVISLRARISQRSPVRWEEFTAEASADATAAEWREIFRQALETIQGRVAPAITRLGNSPVSEDYVVFRIDRLTDGEGRALPASTLPDEAISQFLLGETRPLSAATRRDLLSPRFSYFEDDLAVLTWNAALVMEPVGEDTDVQYVLEFANAQLLELRFYDLQLDRELPGMYDRIEVARHGFHLLGRRYSQVLAALQGRVAEITEVVERTENAIKMTDDVFLARIYAAALELFRDRAWRHGIDRKLGIVRETYSMLNAESQARRSEALEWIIVLLILFEIVLAFVKP